MNDTFRAKLRNGDKLIGAIMTLTSPAVAEILADAGFDWLFVDGEHGPFETRDLEAILQTVGADVACIFRVPSCDEAPIKRALDLGVTGIIVPQVNRPEQAERVASYSRYAPMGARGVGIARAQGYGAQFQQYLDTANDRVTVIVQAEHRLAVESIESIVRVPGIDAVLLGPYDLSASYGKLGQIDDPEIVAAIDHVIATCKEAKVPVGAFGLTADAVLSYAEKGCTLLVVGVDTVFLSNAAEGALTDVRKRC